MARFVEDVTRQLREKSGLVLSQDSDAKAYVRAFSAEDPLGGDSARPVLMWDPDVGFIATDDFADEFPETEELLAALEFVRDYRADAIFVIDCSDLELAPMTRQLKRPLMQLQMKLQASETVDAVIIAGEVLPAALSEKLPWAGEAGGDEPASGDSQAPAAHTSDSYSDLKEWQTFDTAEWEERLENMKPEEVEQIIQARAHERSIDRLNDLRAAMRERFARKDQIVEAVCAATVAQVPTVLIGPPGTAKSNLIRVFCEGLGLTSDSSSNGNSNGDAKQRNYFEYLLTRYTTPEEIFGPIHVQDLINKQVYRRVTDGYLPESQIAFLDEIFKASSAILNTLLTLLNERIFYNGGTAQRVPLMMVFAASNEAPADEGLQALYDRFPLRLNCQSVADEHTDELLEAAWGQAYDRQFGLGNRALEQMACANDLRLLRHVMRQSFGAKKPGERGRTRLDFQSEFMRFFRSLRSDYNISDRTISHLLAYCRAQALLKKAPELTTDELNVFSFVEWDETSTGELDRLVANMKRGVRI